MARKHGRTGRLYADFSSAGAAAAVPIASLTQWSIDFSTDKVDATAFGDTNKQYLAGLPDSSGTFSGFYDDTERSAYAAAIDNTANNARRFYLYPDTNSTTKYWFGLGLFDASYSASVDGAIELSGNWAASSNIIGVGII
jgi:hypothetical protein